MKHIHEEISAITVLFTKELAILNAIAAVDWGKVEKDTLVIVADSIGELSGKSNTILEPRYFAHANTNSFSVYLYGANSKTINRKQSYTYCLPLVTAKQLGIKVKEYA